MPAARTPRTRQPARDAAPSEGPEREYRLLHRFLAGPRQFRLGIATHATLPQRDALIARAIDDLAGDGIAVTRLDLGGKSRATRLIDEVQRHVETHPPAPGHGFAVMVTGLDSLVDLWSPAPPPDAFAVFDNANLHRDLFPAACPAPLVLWLSPFATAAFSQRAPDLWDWRSASFDFADAPEARLAVAPRQAIGLERDDYWNEPPDKLHQQRAMYQDLLAQLGPPGPVVAASTAPGPSPLAGEGRRELPVSAGVRGALAAPLTPHPAPVGPPSPARGEGRIGDGGRESPTGSEDSPRRRFQRANLLLELGRVQRRLGELDAALEHFAEAAALCQQLADTGDDQAARGRAIARGEIADVLQARGELDEALRIRREEELPVYERLGDVRSRAVTWGKIADVLQARGELNEALRIRREESLPVFERLGDARSYAATWSRIADVLQGRGELDEALRIRREEQLPVFERLGDVHARALTWGKIAQCLAAKGDFDQAIRIYREDVVPANQKLGGLHDQVFDRWELASLLLQRGRAEDRPEAETLLRAALADAKRLRVPEAQAITTFMQQQGIAEA